MIFLSLIAVPSLVLFCYCLTYFFSKARSASIGMFVLSGYISILLLTLTMMIRQHLNFVEFGYEPAGYSTISWLIKAERSISRFAINPVFVYLDGCLRIVTQGFYEIASLHWFTNLHSAFNHLFPNQNDRNRMMNEYLSKTKLLDLIHELMPNKFSLPPNHNYVCEPDTPGNPNLI